MELGIAGVPDDVNAVEDVCKALGIQPVYILGPHQTIALEGRPLHLLHIPRWESAELRDRLRKTGLSGLWAAEPGLHAIVAETAAYFNWPHLPCPADSALLTELIAGARLVPLEALTDRASSAGVAPPFWVRPACGDGDTSCMRIDNPGDLPLTAKKLANRGVTGMVRLQPAVEGPIYRLMAYKTGRDLMPFDLVEEETTTSMFRVPLAMSMPAPRRGSLGAHVVKQAEAVNRVLPHGWGYVEMEFVGTDTGLKLVDVQCPAVTDPLLRNVALRSQGVDLLRAVLQCAIGRLPMLTPARELGVASAWLLTRSGTVTGVSGVDEARTMTGIAEVHIVARQGDDLTHVVDLPTRDRGGYVIATGATGAVARERLEAARKTVVIHTTPVKS